MSTWILIEVYTVLLAPYWWYNCHFNNSKHRGQSATLSFTVIIRWHLCLRGRDQKLRPSNDICNCYGSPFN